MRGLLRVLAAGVALRMALLPVPRPWLHRILPALGLGPLPEGPAMDYILRTTCVIYFLGGLFCWRVARDVRAEKQWVAFLSWSTLFFGAMIAIPDWAFNRAAGWPLATGLGTVLLGVGMVGLTAGIRPSPANPQPQTTGPWRPARALTVLLATAGAASAAGIAGVTAPMSALSPLLAAADPGVSPHSPMAPVMAFLLRSLFAAAFLGGVFLWILSRDPRRHAPTVRFLAGSSLFFGAVITLGDLPAVLPGAIKLIGPLAVAFGAVVALLARRCGTVKASS